MEKEIDFEKELENLKNIVDTLEKGNESLNDSLKLFERGNKLANELKQYLNDLKNKIDSEEI